MSCPILRQPGRCQLQGRLDGPGNAHPAAHEPGDSRRCAHPSTPAADLDAGSGRQRVIMDQERLVSRTVNIVRRCRGHRYRRDVAAHV